MNKMDVINKKTLSLFRHYLLHLIHHSFSVLAFELFLFAELVQE